jgi:hypothetical protein
VDDASTAELMGAFFEGVAKAEKAGEPIITRACSRKPARMCGPTRVVRPRTIGPLSYWWGPRNRGLPKFHYFAAISLTFPQRPIV